MRIYFHIAFAISIIDISAENTDGFKNSSLDHFHGSPKLLSRRKRFLIFPDGSSFQLVFCAQNHGYLQIGNIVWFGNTAALAWELPSDPKYFTMFKDHQKLIGETGNRRQDVISKFIYFMDEQGKVIGKKPYKRKPLINPAFAKRRLDMERSLTRKQLHDLHRNNQILKIIPPDTIEFHRSGRKDLYEKIETFLNSMGWNGKECILRFLCEARKGGTKQGHFLEEIFRATFTLPRGPEFDLQKHKQYDDAHGTNGDCDTMYPKCEDVNRKQMFEQ